MSEELVGSRVGDYRLEEFVGAGAMGEVYRGVHKKIGRVVAIKVLTQISDPVLVERFLNEGRVHASLHHNNIVILHDFLEVGGHPCIIMEYVAGQTLLERIKADGGLPISRAICVFQALVEAIGYMHDNGIIHRDIKPSNVKLAPDGQVKLLDFGISKADHSPRLTRSGDVVGTLLYLAPEQLRGEPASYQTDLWSLGVLLYQMVTGNSPYGPVKLADLPDKIINADYLAPAALRPQLPSGLIAIINGCLKKDPQERYQTARSLLQDLAPLLAGSRAPSTGEAQREAGLRAVIKSYWPAGVSLSVVLLLGGLYFFTTPVKPRDVAVKSPQIAVEEEEAHTRDLRPVRIGVLGTAAMLYLRSAERWVGPFDTPYEFKRPLGERVDWMLKSPGYRDKLGHFTVQPVNQYTYVLCKQDQECAPD